jgi:hypothetical protein
LGELTTMLTCRVVRQQNHLVTYHNQSPPSGVAAEKWARSSPPHYRKVAARDGTGPFLWAPKPMWAASQQTIVGARRVDGAVGSTLGGFDMTRDVERPSAAMEAGGFYNRHSLIPSGGGALAVPHLERAIADVPLEPVDLPVVIADYGSSQGLNSLAPMRLAIESVRRRSSADRPILVYHVDQPSNDFNSLFELLDTNPGRYSLHDPCVYPCAIGRSFYESVLPPNSVHIGWIADARGDPR